MLKNILIVNAKTANTEVDHLIALEEIGTIQIGSKVTHLAEVTMAIRAEGHVVAAALADITESLRENTILLIKVIRKRGTHQTTQVTNRVVKGQETKKKAR
jgi:hypothetical protein